MRDESAPISLHEFEQHLERKAKVEWIPMNPGRGFAVTDNPTFRALYYESHGGIVVHFYGDEKTLKLCEDVAESLGAIVIIL